MSKAAAVKVDHIADVPTDLPGVFLRVERRHWKDGSSCVHIAKWGTQKSGRKAPWIPLQYIQFLWHPRIAQALGESLQKVTL